jgi:hypothetical protein
MLDRAQSPLICHIPDNDRPVLAHRARLSLLSCKPMKSNWLDLAQGTRDEQMLARFLSQHELDLARDPRMCSVWRELDRQRADGTFVYPARDAWWEQRRYSGFSVGAANASERQAEALLEVLDTMVACKLLPIATTTWREVEQEQAHYQTLAHELKLAAKTIRENPNCPVDKRYEHERRLKEAAKICADYAHETYAAAARTALAYRHDGRTRWVALAIANKLHELFGLPMFGTTATITSVVLGRTVTLRAVRQWCCPAGSGSTTTRYPHSPIQI